ncbi:MAG: TIGR00268 family protein, partial [Acidaminococcaceae bacterium]|nr:TIGR00268 family protein [Acidaminococcaceae bacterium]
ACLASRIPYNEILTKEKLARIEKAEEFLAKYGFGQLRVRCHKKLARLEVKQEDFVKLLDPVIRTEIIAYLRKLGFLYITLDLQGYRTGSFNEVL